MAGKKVRNEIDGIRSELQNLSEAVWALREHVAVQNAAAAATRQASSISGPPPHLADALADQEAAVGIATTQGLVRDASGVREFHWDFQATTTELLAIDDEEAAHLLAAIGHRQRLAILKTILNSPTTAADLVSTLNLGTTGAAYHHLNVLQAANLVTQESRGVFEVHPQRVSTLFAILAGLASTATVCLAESSDPDDDVTFPNGEATAAPKERGKRKRSPYGGTAASGVHW